MDRNAKSTNEGTAMNGKRGFTMTMILAAGALLASGFAAASIPEPDHIFYGPLPDGAESVLVAVTGGGVQVASYAVGPSAGGQYILRVPIDSIEERSPGTARPGDVAEFFVNGERVTSVTVGQPGSVRFVGLTDEFSGEGVSIRDVSVVEGDQGTVDAVFQLYLGKKPDRRVVVYWDLEDGTATRGEDFGTPSRARRLLAARGRKPPAMPSPRTSRVVFRRGQDTASLTVPVICDENEEDDETFVVRLVSATGAPIDRGTATGTIVDDDAQAEPAILVAGSRVEEGNATSAGVAVSLSHASGEEVTVDWNTVGGPATAGDDFVGAEGTLTFAPGETYRWIDLTILDDAEPEPDERFRVALTRPVHAVLGATEAVLMILDDDRPAGPVLGRASFTDRPRRVQLARGPDDPVVVLGPPTNQTGTTFATVERVDRTGFQVTLQAVGSSTAITTREEDASYLVIDRGGHVMSDGSVWEAGSFEILPDGLWNGRLFEHSFPGSPVVMLTVQGGAGAPPAVARARSVGPEGFEAAAFGLVESDEANSSPVVVGYLALYSAGGSGTVTVGGEPTPYLVQRPRAGQRSTPVLSWSVRASTFTGSETPVDVLAIGPHMFAQEVGGGPGGPVAIEARPAAPGAPMEWGTVLHVGESWTTVPTSGRYVRPVAIAKPVVAEPTEAFSVRIRQVGGNGFAVRCEPWFPGGRCADTRVTYVLADEGAHDLSGLRVQAGTLETDRPVSSGWEVVSLDVPFAETPVVLVGLQTDQNPAVRARVHNRNAGWFDVGLERRSAAGETIVPETVGWIAVEPGRATGQDGRRFHAYSAIAMDPSASGRIGSTAGSDPRAAQGRRGRTPRTRWAGDRDLDFRVTVAGTGSTYLEVPSLVCDRTGQIEVRVPGSDSSAVAEDICIVRAD